MTKLFIVIIAGVFIAGCSSSKEVTTAKKTIPPQGENKTKIKDEALIHFINGSVLETKGEYAEAILEFQDALRLDPAAGVYYALAKNYLVINKIPLALQNGEKAIIRYFFRSSSV